MKLKKVLVILMTGLLVFVPGCGEKAENQVTASELADQKKLVQKDTEKSETSKISKKEDVKSEEKDSNEKKTVKEKDERSSKILDEKSSEKKSGNKSSTKKTSQSSGAAEINKKPSKPSNTTQEKPKPSKPSGSTEEKPKPSKPSGSTEEKPKPSKPSGSTEEKPKPSKPSGSTEEKPKPSKPSGTTEEKPKPEHKHNWVANTTVVHHEEKGHMEKYVIKEAWDEKVIEYVDYAWTCCNVCGADCTGNTSAHMKAHALAGEGGGYHVEYDTREEISYIHHNAEYGERWVVDQAAWDETVITGYHCSGCGATKSA